MLLAGVAGSADQEGCLLCHRLGLRTATNGAGRSLDIRDAPGGNHGSLYCSDCHPDARTIPHPAPPGPSNCIGECHGSNEGATASHRKAAFGGLTETHRKVVSPRPPCLACHAYGDAKGDYPTVNARCVSCHRSEAHAVRKGPHWRMAGGSGGCVGCHPAHPGGAAGSTSANCGGTGCHPRGTAGMRAIVDHRVRDPAALPWAKGGVFIAIVVLSWRLAAITRSGDETERRPE